jgi:uncharacterized cupredoxin-like copper-binding protein
MTMHGSVVWFGALAITASLGATACGDDDDDDGGEAGAVAVTLRDFEIELDPTSAPAGEVTFEVRNDGPSVHEFVVFQTDLAPNELPTDDSGDVAEGEDFEPVDEIEDIAVDADEVLTVDLEAGSYVVICNVPGHYRQGMAEGFTVS